MSKEKDFVKTIKFQDIIENDSNSNSNPLGKIIKGKNNQKKNEQKIKPPKILMIVVGIIIVCIAVAIGIYFGLKKKTLKTPSLPIDSISDMNIDIDIDTDNQKIIDNYEIPEYMKKEGPIEMELDYKIKTEVNDSLRIYINQKYYEDIKIDGLLIKNLIDRKTNYDIIILDKIEAPNEAKYFYNYTFLCAISISSECVSSKDEFCIPKKLVDLFEHDNSNLRNLKEIDSLENFPIPLCFFNLTDNNVITSIACHKKINESKINSMVLDLYFFRPPGIKRFDKEKANITISKTKVENNEVIEEKNGGICDIDDPRGSFCTTDMITTKDSEGKLLTYEEVAFTNITTDANNSYIKNKFTKLIDKTSYLSDIDKEKCKQTVTKLYSNIENYLKYYEHFSLDNFKVLYNVSKGISSESDSKRRLTDNNPMIVSERKLFSFKNYGGVNIQISLKDNAGINSQKMEASNFLAIDGNKIEFFLNKFTDMDIIIKKLIYLSNAGNNLATKLYNKIKENLNNITEIININIPSMNLLLVYKELTDIFDSTFSLKNLKIVPYGIIEESDYLINKLEEIYNGIDNGMLKSNIEVLDNYIYKYIKQSHILVNNISNNLYELGNLIKSPKQTISDISNYYMNHTSVSYINTIKEAKNILMNYYENEKNLIIPKVKEILEKFENVTIESLEKQLNLINNLINKFENNELNITNSNQTHYKKIIINLHNSNIYINNIIQLFKKKVENEMNLKNGYFISQNDINSNNETFTRIINEAIIIAQKLDDNEYVDKIFDEIMTNFRRSFIDITKDMDNQREENFILDEDFLKGKISEQKNISKELKDLGVGISLKINEENNLYLDKVDQVIKEFLENNRAHLNQLIEDINFLFSINSLDELKNSYENALDRHFYNISSDLETNKQLAYEYFDGMASLLKNNSRLEELLQYYQEKRYFSLTESICGKITDLFHCINNTFFTDSIINKKKGKDYINKYKTFKEKFDTSKKFIESDLHINILNEYQNVVIKLKEVLQTFKNNKIRDKYPYYTDLYFIDEHIEDIEEFYNRLNRYISDDIFNNYYFEIIENYKKNETQKIEDIKKYIENKHLIINVGEEGKEKDICTSFTRKRTFTCRNGAIYNYENIEGDCIISFGSDNIGKMVKISFNNDNIFQSKFNTFFTSIKNKIDIYNSLINQLKEKIISIEANILDKKITNNYLSPIQNKVNLILSEKYSDNLILASHNYFKDILDKRLENILNDISNKWINSFDNLTEKVNDNLINFNHSINEFGVMALIYEVVISSNLTKNYYNSIINHQKSEFNYTISYYYNCLLQNITSVYQYVLSHIPTNQVGFNNITNKRKKEVEDVFNQLLKIVNDSKLESLSIDRQTYVLQVSSSNFFNTDSNFSKINIDTSTKLKQKGNYLYKLKNGKQNDDFSLASRFYLENSLNGLHLEEYFQPVNEKDTLFISLNEGKFLKLFSDNWIFDQDDFINQLNISIYNSNIEIRNDISFKKLEYSKKLENEIIIHKYSKENISEKIFSQYKSNINKIDEEKKNAIYVYIHEILNFIKNHLINEKEILLKYATSYTNNFSKINETIKTYKDEIYGKLKNIMEIIVDNFDEKLKKAAFTELIEPGLNIYLEKAENYIKKCKTYEILNISYNIGEIMYDIVKGLVEEYKNITKRQLDYSHGFYIEKLKRELDLEGIRNIINNDFNLEYSELLTVLKNKNQNIQSGTIGYNDYDLSDDIKNEIEIKIEEVFENITDIFNEIKVNKNNKIELIGWENLKLCYDSIDSSTFYEIEKDFEQFISPRKNSEKDKIDIFLKNIIKKNFNNVINNLIFTFGNEFLERMIRYNDNYKISTLYQNLKFSLVISLNYYQMLYNFRKDIKSLSNDLKIKLYGLNNLDKITEKENTIILNMLNDKIDEFIEKSKYTILDDYQSFLKSDTSIQLQFGSSIEQSIENNLNSIRGELEKDYTSLLNEQFKKNFINSYTKIMNEKTNDMIQTVNNLKESIKSLFDDLFSLDIEKVLNQSNYQMNKTLDSIEEYKTHFDTFKVPEELIEYSFNYGNNYLKPIYEKLEFLINNETKSLTWNNVNNRSKEFEKSFISDEIMSKIDVILLSIKRNNDNILNEINSYGINDYPTKLQDEINKLSRRALRRLNEEQTEEDEIEEYQEKIGVKSIDENFHKLLNISKNTQKFIETYEYFDQFIEDIENKKKKLNLSFQRTQQIISETFQDDDFYKELIDKLGTLYELSLNYYNEIKGNFTTLINYTKNSINEIDNSLNECENITYKTFEDKYDEISREAETFDNLHNDTEKDITPITHLSGSQNNEFETNVEIKSLIKKARFKFSFIQEEEGKMKKPKILAIINNEIKPEQLKFKIAKHFGTCGQNYQEVDVSFNKVNYTIVLYFDTKSTLINYTIITDFEPYEYTKGDYKIEDTETNACSQYLGVGLCLDNCDDSEIEIVEPPKKMKMAKVNEIESKEFIY